MQVTRLATLDQPPAANWVMRYSKDKVDRWLGLGSVNDFTLEEARDRARKARQQIADGIDPVASRKAEKATRALAAAKQMTFEKAAEEFFDAHQSKWKSAVHRQQFQNTLATYALPTIGKLAVTDIDTGLILKVLEPIWATKTETASRLRQRLEAVLAWATVREYRKGDNPARWRNHLDKVLPAPGEVTKVKHHPSMPYADVPAFVAELRGKEGVAARALEMTILCATRTSETILARWSEFDLANATWTIPKERMKAAAEHRIPLSDHAVELVRAMPREGEFVFVGMRKGTSISSMSMLAVLERMGRDNFTVHGFRSSFSTWAADRTSYPEHVIEAALAHTISDAVKKAYKRTTMVDRRGKLMQAWSDYCLTPAQQSSATVVSLRG